MLNTVCFVDKSDLKQIGNATARINDLQSALSKAEATVLLIVSAYFQAKQKEQEHQASLAELQQQLEVSHRQNETIRSNVEME